MHKPSASRIRRGNGESFWDSVATRPGAISAVNTRGCRRASSVTRQKPAILAPA